MAQDSHAPSGIGGWLILPMIGLFLTIFVNAGEIFTIYMPLFSEGDFAYLTNEASEVYHPLWGPLLLMELGFAVLLIMYAIVVLCLFFGRHYLVPKLMIAFYSVVLVFAVVDIILVLQIPYLREELAGEEMYKDIFRSAVACAIWVPYFIKSERVKNTFVRGRKRKTSPFAYDHEAS